ncbi:hypothetical protein ACFLV0_03965 [Chloroflexota bacterium]
MKSLLTILISVIVIASLVFGSSLVASSATDSNNPGPNVVVADSVVKWDTTAKIQILGCGFKPEQEIHLLITDVNGVLADFTMYACTPVPVTNEQGAWATEWTGLGRMLSRKLITPGAYAIVVANENYETLAAAPIWVLEQEEQK